MNAQRLWNKKQWKGLLVNCQGEKGPSPEKPTPQLKCLDSRHCFPGLSEVSSVLPQQRFASSQCSGEGMACHLPRPIFYSSHTKPPLSNTIGRWESHEFVYLVPSSLGAQCSFSPSFKVHNEKYIAFCPTGALCLVSPAPAPMAWCLCERWHACVSPKESTSRRTWSCVSPKESTCRVSHSSLRG